MSSFIKIGTLAKKFKGNKQASKQPSKQRELYIYAPHPQQGLSILVNELPIATCIMQSFSNELSTW